MPRIYAAFLGVLITGVVGLYAFDENRHSGKSKCDDIAIIGAGVTGSYAAWRLRQKNLRISLYEYSNRIGGRCFTVKFPGIPDVNVEMGAMRFLPDDHPLMNKTVQDLGLNIVDFELGLGPGEDSLFYLRGRHMKYNELPTHAPYNLPPENRVDLKTLNCKCTMNVFKNFTLSSQNGDALKSLDGLDLYMQSRDMYMAKYLDTETVHYIRESDSMTDGHGPDVAAANKLPTSAPSLLSSIPKVVKTVKQRFQAIPVRLVGQFLQASYKHKCYYNRHLRYIRRHSNGNYLLTFQPTTTKAGVTTDIKRRRVITACAKKVILAIPRLALEHLDWEGLRQEIVQDYLKHSLKDIKAVKIFFGYDEPWWRHLSKAAKYALSATPLRQTLDFGVSKKTLKGVLNTAYTDEDNRIWREAQRFGELLPGVGDNSIAMTNLSVYLARKFYAEVFNISLIDVQEPKSAVMIVWDQYPIGASCYSWAPGYKWEEVESRIIKPSASDDVYITSNVFSSSGRSGWIEGGMEIVEKVLNYF